MNVKTIAYGSVLIFALASLPAESLAQGGRPDFRIKSIRQEQTQAPNYAASGGDLGGRSSALARSWYKIEVQFTSEPEWADDVQLKFYVLIGKGREQRLFTTEVTHVNVAKSSTHYSGVFMHPNTLKRYGAGQVEAVAVQLFYKGALQDQESDPKTSQRWWERLTPVPGFLLTPPDSPWAPVAHERFEAIKPRP